MAETDTSDTLIEALKAWPDALAAADAMFFKGEADPVTRGTGHFVYVLDHTPGWERFVQVWERASRILPPLRKRVVRPAVPGRLPLWRDDPNFDLRFHLRRLRVPAPGTLREVFDYAEADGMTPHDPGRPLWQVTLMEGLEGDGAALLLKFHHSWMDGNATIQLAQLVYDADADADLTKPMPERPAAGVRRPFPVEAVARAQLQAARRVHDFVGLAGRVTRRVVTDPVHLLGEAAELVASTRRVVTPPSAAPSPLLRGRSAGSRFEILDVPFAELRRAAKSIDCTVNDAYLAGVTGGLRRYHEHFDVHIAELPIGMPISTRATDDPALGNQAAAALIAAPVGVADPAERMKRVHEIVLGARYEPAMEVLGGAAANVLVHLPDRLMAGPMMQLVKVDVGVSQVRGLLEPSYLAGAQIMRSYGFGPHLGLAAFIGMMTHLDTCCIGVHADPAAITEPAVFMACLADGFDEVLAVGRPPRRTRSGRSGDAAT